MRRRFAAAIAVMASLAAFVGAGCSGSESERAPVVVLAPHDAGPPPALARADAAVDPPAGAAAQRVDKALKLVSRARGLSVLRPVNIRVLPRKELIAYVKGRVTKDVPAEAIVHEGRVLSILGFLPTDYDYLAGTLALLDAQLAGLYEPDDGTMYIADDLDDVTADSTLDHELTHALQDQHYDLKTRTKYVPGRSDAQGALSSLSEGDAMSAMVDVLLRRQHAPAGKTSLDVPDDLWRAQAAGMNEGKAASAPAIMKAELVAPYIDGTLFVQALRRAGGWPAVDEAWRSPPSSSEQLLHVDKWTAHEAPLMVSAPPPPPPAPAASGAASAAGSTPWTLADEDTYGELELRIFLSQWFGDEDGAYLAAGWGGDRGALYERGDETAFALHVRYDGGVKLEARSFLDHLVKKLGKASVRKANLACFERADRGPLLVQLDGTGGKSGEGGTELLLVAGGVRIGSGAAMTSSATCASAIAWGKSLLAAP